MILKTDLAGQKGDPGPPGHDGIKNIKCLTVLNKHIPNYYS